MSPGMTCPHVGDNHPLKQSDAEHKPPDKYKHPADPLLYPKNYEAVARHALIGGLRTFLLAYGIRGGISFLLKLIHVFKGKVVFREAFCSAFFGKDTVCTGISFGLFSFLWKSVHHVLRLVRGVDDRWNGFFAGGIAGLSVAIEPKHRRELFAQQLAVRALQSIYNGAKSREMPITRIFNHGDALLFILCSSQLMYSYVLHPYTLPKAYLKFMIETAGVSAPVLKVIRDSLRSNPLDIASVTELAKRIRMTPENLEKIAALSPHPSIIPCVLTHPTDMYCSRNGASLWLDVLRKILPVYATLNFVPMVLLRLAHFRREPGKLSRKAAFSTARSSVFLAFFVTGYQCLICSHRKVFDSAFGRSIGYRDNKFVYWICGVMTSLSIFIENKSRRAELALYVFPKAVDSFYQIMYQRRLIFRMPHFEVLLCSTAVGIIMSFYQKEPEVLSPLISKIFHKLFGRY